ncbi:MAG TPA: immunoglobulin domain-containing protein [Verrucomicrobiae bacterium]|nr:immunoglobulin domain-containing protein [Verrucomicrobiae bacterium]
MKMFFTVLSLFALSLIFLPPSSQAQHNILDPLPFFGPNIDGSIRPGEKPYVTTGNAQRGLAYNPQSGYLVFIDRVTGSGGSTFSGSIYILHWNSGDAISTLTPNGIEGGNFATMATGVADDGAIYVGNQVNDGTASNFKLYRWSDDVTIDPPLIVFSGDPGNGRAQRWGDTMDIRGAGTNTQIILGSRTSGTVMGTNVAILTTTDGTNFTARTLSLDVSDSATGGGIAFGAGDTFWAKNVDVPLRQFSFDLAAGTATTLRSYGTDVLVDSRTLEALAVDVANNFLAAIDMTSATDNVRLYDISDVNNPPVLLDIRDFAVNNANATTTKGYAAFGSDFGTPLLYAHNINNGLMGFAILPIGTSAPTIRQQPRPQRVLSGRTVTLEVLAYPAATYQWQRNGANVTGATGAVLRLVNAQPSQAGLYRVLVSNQGGTTISDEVSINIINAEDLFHLAPLWSATPGVAPYVTSTGGTSTPNERSIGFNALSNQLYVVQRNANNYTVHVVDGSTGAKLYNLRTNGILPVVASEVSGQNGIGLVAIDVGDDGAVYACNSSPNASGGSNPFAANKLFRVYRWANSDSNTLPVQIFEGDPAGQTANYRWGDVLDARGSGIDTQLLLDNQNANVRFLAILTPADDTMTAFLPRSYTQNAASIPGASIGRSLDFGVGDTFWQKRRINALVHSSFDQTTTTVTATYTNFPASIGQVVVDLTRNIFIGINYGPNNATVPDTLDLYDFSSSSEPLLLAQYNFPIVHQNNANFIGRVLLSGDKVFALGGNNGILAFRIVSGPQSPPTILGQPLDARAVEGNAISLSVITADLATFQWQFNSNNIPNATNSTYDIASAAAHHAGSYRVMVSNQAGSVTSLTATVTVEPASEFARLSPLWSLAPLSRPYLRRDSNAQGQTPLYRGIAYNALSNQVYVISRVTQTGGLEISVLDASTGADLYQLNTSGITGGSIVLLGMAVADDGALYAANMSELANTSLTYNLYRWANSDPATVPALVFSGDPAVGVTDRLRWGDTLDVRGAGLNTEIVADANSGTAVAIFRPNDETMNTFTPAALIQNVLGGSIGRSLEFGEGNSLWQKRKATALQLSTFEATAPSTTVVSNFAGFPSSLGPVALDFSRNLLAGIDFASSSTVPDTLALYDVSDLNDPLLIARYNFPTNQQPNGNFIGQVLFAGNRVWAVDGNNGVVAFSILPPSGPPLSITRSGSNVLISWDSPSTGFVLQKSPTMAAGSWVDVSTPPDVQNGRNIVTESAATGTQFYRLAGD